MHILFLKISNHQDNQLQTKAALEDNEHQKTNAKTLMETMQKEGE